MGASRQCARGRSELQRMVDISGKMALVDDTLYAVTYQGHVAHYQLQRVANYGSGKCLRIPV